MSAVPFVVDMNASRSPPGAQLGEPSIEPPLPKPGVAASAPVPSPFAVHSLKTPLTSEAYARCSPL
jgi:hypothetical protein